MQAIDTIMTTEVEENDLIELSIWDEDNHLTDTVEVITVHDMGDEIIIVGDSHVSGDRVEYTLSATEAVYLMGA